ncbi:hypothetical protein GGS23DRAFT_585843 [Durotheca rogersii]|uniref:uncharacterized protein n=1 Tax=Durotheca rogersii TaxID=419775 RepID=UPI002220242A|nr:uncharacterized protein GGS23DRAFT_585843 [Durotheca rogersii]KAI5859322.1 hypothetical protein GGS23DRAFT_585843 [Durotheca rogersii]
MLDHGSQVGSATVWVVAVLCVPPCQGCGKRAVLFFFLLLLLTPPSASLPLSLPI